MVDERRIALELAVKHFANPANPTHNPLMCAASIVAMAADFERFLRYGADKKSDSSHANGPTVNHVANATVTA
jgi:hypothetical protein